MTKDLADKAIDIKGKQYVLVSDRIKYFNEEYKLGYIQTKLLSSPDLDSRYVVMAKITPDVATPERFFTGHSQAEKGKGMVNAMAALENAETSAIGRALGMMGIGVIDSVASVDEMRKAGVASHPVATLTEKDEAWISEDGFTHEPIPDLSEPPIPALICGVCGKAASHRTGNKNGKQWAGIFCSTGDKTHTRFID